MGPKYDHLAFCSEAGLTNVNLASLCSGEQMAQMTIMTKVE